jgi:hypothetical protein
LSGSSIVWRSGSDSSPSNERADPSKHGFGGAVGGSRKSLFRRRLPDTPDMRADGWALPMHHPPRPRCSAWKFLDAFESGSPPLVSRLGLLKQSKGGRRAACRRGGAGVRRVRESWRTASVTPAESAHGWRAEDRRAPVGPRIGHNWSASLPCINGFRRSREVMIVSTSSIASASLVWDLCSLDL